MVFQILYSILPLLMSVSVEINMRSEKLKKKALIKALDANLIRYFHLMGFSQIDLSAEDRKSGLSSRMPFGTLKKDIEKGVALVEVLFLDKDVPKFFIDVAVAPKCSIVLPNGQILAAEEIHTSALPTRYRLSSSRICKRSFGIGLFFSDVESASEMLATKATLLSEELVDWFNSGKVGRHMHKLVSLVGDEIVKSKGILSEENKR